MLRDTPRSSPHATNLLRSSSNLLQSWAKFILRKSFILLANIRNLVWESIKEAKFTNKTKRSREKTAPCGTPDGQNEEKCEFIILKKSERLT